MRLLDELAEHVHEINMDCKRKAGQRQNELRKRRMEARRESRKKND